MNRFWKIVLSLATIGTATWVAAMLSGQIIVLVSGVPASSAVLNGFVVPFLLVLGVRTVRHPWSVTIAFTTYGILSIPFLLLGPPGVHKVVVAFLAGVIADLVLLAVPKKFGHASYVLAFSVWGLALAGVAWLAFQIEALALPGKEQFLQVFPVLTAIFVVEAAAASLVASVLFKSRKLDSHPTVNRLRVWIQQ